MELEQLQETHPEERQRNSPVPALRKFPGLSKRFKDSCAGLGTPLLLAFLGGILIGSVFITSGLAALDADFRGLAILYFITGSGLVLLPPAIVYLALR